MSGHLASVVLQSILVQGTGDFGPHACRVPEPGHRSSALCWELEARVSTRGEGGDQPAEGSDWGQGVEEGMGSRRGGVSEGVDIRAELGPGEMGAALCWR